MLTAFLDFQRATIVKKTLATPTSPFAKRSTRQSVRRRYTSRCMMVSMSRTNIDLDDDLVAIVMDRYNMRTKKEAVNFALKQLVGGVMTREQALAMEGFGWNGDLNEIRPNMVIEDIWA